MKISVSGCIRADIVENAHIVRKGERDFDSDSPGTKLVLCDEVHYRTDRETAVPYSQATREAATV
jgi:hypothetical protein